MKVPDHYIVIVPGFLGSKLRHKETKEVVWGDFTHIPLNPLEWDEWLYNLFSKIEYPNDSLEPAGIMDEVTFILPWAKQEHYGRLMYLLAGLGYKIDDRLYSPKELNVYTFAYDWRQDNRLSARQLGESIARWSSYHPGAKAWIIAHSNGGIVSRWYIEKEGGKDKVERLFLLGVPWDGAPKAMQVLIHGLTTFIRRRFNIFSIRELTRNAMRSFPSAYQLIPVSNPFLRDNDNEVVDPFYNSGWLSKEGHKRFLQEARKMREDLGLDSSVETICFFGRKLSTVSAGIVRFTAGQSWKDIQWLAMESGDGTVPERSAIHPDAQVKYPFVVGHGDIYANPAVLDVLEWELIGKYHLAKRAMLIEDRLMVNVEIDKDFYNPGEMINLRLKISERGETAKTIDDARVQAQLVWRQELPGTEVLGKSISSLNISVESDPKEPGSYKGQVRAPVLEGYYEIRGVINVMGWIPTLFEELIVVESDTTEVR